MVDSEGRTRRDGLYEEVAAKYGSALERLARGYEADPDKRRDLLQEIVWMNLREARKVQSEIDQLDAGR